MTLWTQFLGGTVEWVDADGVRTRMLRLPGPGDRGQAPPLLLLHGRGGHLETFVHNARAWSAHREVIAVDLLGHGLTAQQGERYDIGELLDHVAGVIAHLGVAEIDVVGQSLGGWVAARLALRPDTPVRRLVLIEPAGLQDESERLADPRVRSAYERGGRSFASPTIDTVRLRFAQLLHDHRKIDDEMVELRLRLYQLPGATAVHQAVRAADNRPWLLTREQLPTLRPPCLFLRGAHGHLPVEVLQQAADAVAAGRLLTVPDAKQWPHYENPAVVNPAVDQFLQEELS